MNLKLNVKKEGLALSPNELINNEEFELNFGHVFRGERGADGKSAYDSAVEGGYKGTEQEFNIGLKDLNNKPNKEGYYPKMSVGVADDLVGRGDVQDAYINFRPSGGVNKNIKDGAARIKAIKGNSVVWNQQLQFHSYQDWQSSTLTIEGQSIILTPRAIQRYCTIVYSIDFKATHKYLVAFNLSLQSSKTFVDEFYAGYIATPTIWLPKLTADQVNSLKNTPMTIAQIVNIDSERTSIAFGLYEAMYEQATVIFDSDDSVIVDSPTIIDLTLMFGAGNEPKTIEEFSERKPMNIKDEFAYNAGEIIDMHANELVSTSDNAYNPAEKKAYVMPNAKYHITDSANSEFIEIIFSYYDADGSLILDADFDIVEEDGKTYYLFPQAGWVEVNMAQGDICVCLSHSYDKPHPAFQQDVKDLSFIGEAFPEAMRSAGSAFDEIRFSPTKKKWEAVKRVGEIDLGSLRWYKQTGGNNTIRFYASTTSFSPKPVAATNAVANWTCSKYATMSADKTYMANDGISLTPPDSYNPYGLLYVYDANKVDITPEEFAAFIDGVTLYYELAEPIVVELDYPTEETNMDYRVWDFGTEEAITSEPSAPFRAGIEYGFNATDDIRTLLNRVAELEAKLTQLTNE